MRAGGPTSKEGVPVFVVLLLCSLAFFSGHLESSDEVLMAAMSHAIATRLGLTHAELYGQTFSAYGVGTPLLAVPFAWIEWLLRGAGVQIGSSLLPLANSVLFALTGWFGFGTALRLRRGLDPRSVACATVLLMAASPLLPASTTFYSEILASAALTGLLWSTLGGGEPRCRRFVLASAFLCGAFGILARVAMGPFLGMVLLWSWRNDGDRRAIVFGALGMACAVGVWMGINMALRGSPLASGYETSDFTTPLLTGVHGLLLSPERGLFWFFPVIALLFATGADDGKWKAARALATALLVFAVVFHAKFWTWHGGWTMGPRFMLPAIAVAVPLLASLLPDVVRRGGFPAVSAGLLVSWGLFVAAIYAIASPMAVWNDVWGFHQIESRWQFEPQLGLISNWQWLVAGGGARTAFGGIQAAGACVLLAIVAGAALARLRPRRADAGTPAVAFVLLAAALLAAASAASGPRGFSVEAGGERAKVALPYLRLTENGAPWRLSAILDMRLPGTYTFHAKVQGECRIYVDGQPFFEFAEDTPRQLRSWTYEAGEAGTRLMEVEFRPHAGQPGTLNVYWTWPGGGRVMEPLGGQYVLPAEPGFLRRMALGISRRQEILLAGVMALVLLWGARGRKSPGFDASES